jgi:tRNA (guanine-N7-)-methyltransferase
MQGENINFPDAGSDAEAAKGGRVYGRRKGRPLRVRKTSLMHDLLPRLLVNLPAKEKLKPSDIFDATPGQEKEPSLVLEIGFGGGEHLAALAKANPDIGYVGCEPFVNGVASLLDHLDRDGIGNVRIFNDDARLLLDALADATLDTCYVLFADPWPKKRHAERRFIGPENLDRFARVLKRGALLRLASDHPTLVEWMCDCLRADTRFALMYEGNEPPPNWVQTRYQEKAVAAGRQPFFMDYRLA